MSSGIITYSNPKLKRRIMAGDIPKWLQRHPRKSYIIGAVLATAFWVDKASLHEIDRRAKEESRITGFLHVVDHVIPINNPRVCGLTVPENLRVVRWEVNAQKGGAWCEWHGELFDEPEQFRMFV